MNESSETFELKSSGDISVITQRVLECAYLSAVNVDYDTGKFKFAGKTMVGDNILLVSIEVVDAEAQPPKVKVNVNSESTIYNPMLLKQLQKALLGEE